ncbi:MAG: NnrU family protein [Thiohalomonadales bacterium]
MIFLITGIALSIATGLAHTLPASAQRPGKTIGFLSIMVLLTGVGLIIFGMLTVDFIEIWDPPFWAILVPVAIMPFVFILLLSTIIPTKIAKRMRHPAPIGVLMWSSAHLTINGDLAAIILFGSFAISSIISIMILRRRGNSTHRYTGQTPIPGTSPTPQKSYTPVGAFISMHNQSFNSSVKNPINHNPHASPANISAKAFAGEIHRQNSNRVYYDKRVILMGLATFAVVLFFHSFLFGINQD